MIKAYVVIGAGFGDEGKGLTTDYLAQESGQNTLVVRFNGGAQAGHTVVTPSGKRHVFRHFGSGCFTESSNYLSEFFICNPILFHKEWEELSHLTIQPKVFVHPKSLVTTPYDMMINQIIEEYRADKRHGSCGVGINETVERSLREQYLIQVQELLGHTELLDAPKMTNKSPLLEKLLLIQKEWVPYRLAQLGIKELGLLSEAWQQRLSAMGIIDYFLSEVAFFIKQTTLADSNILNSFPTVIFEGAQGLLLDEEKGIFPHITRSSTGLKNVLILARERNIAHLDVFYITRAYLTRHGAGPLPFEQGTLAYANIVDQTNIKNQYQGVLRLAPFNFDLLKEAISSDLAEVPTQMQVSMHLMITCMDQLNNEVQYVIDDKLVTCSKYEFEKQIRTVFADFTIWSSKGDTRISISK